MIKYLQLPFHFDPVRLKADVNGLGADVNGLSADVNGLSADVNGLMGGGWKTHYQKLLNSPVSRIHLVIDTTVNEWFQDLLRCPALVKRKEFIESHAYDAKTAGEIIYRMRLLDTPISHQLADDLERQLRGNSTEAGCVSELSQC